MKGFTHTETITLPNINYRFKICGRSYAFTSITISKKCGVKVSPGRHLLYSTSLGPIWSCVVCMFRQGLMRMATGGLIDNPHLMDNWDDAEGYYRM